MEVARHPQKKFKLIHNHIDLNQVPRTPYFGTLKAESLADLKEEFSSLQEGNCPLPLPHTLTLPLLASALRIKG